MWNIQLTNEDNSILIEEPATFVGEEWELFDELKKTFTTIHFVKETKRGVLYRAISNVPGSVYYEIWES